METKVEVAQEVKKQDLAELESLGFTKAVKNAKHRLDLRRKMVMAYEHYIPISPEKINEFNTELRKRTEKRDAYQTTYDRGIFLPIGNYPMIPPRDVLVKLQEAKKLGCFDAYEVFKIEAVVEKKDPVLFGVIKGCGDKFAIADWDSDVSIADLQGE